MIRNRIVRDYSDYERAKEEMRTDAIHDNGICKTFSFSEKYYDIILDYIKIEDTDIELYPDMFGKRSKSTRSICICNRTYQSIKEFQDIQNSFLMYNEFDGIGDKVKHEFEDIKEECVKKHNAVYSSVDIDVCNIDIDKDHDIISIPYTYYYIKDEFIDKLSSCDVIFGKAPLPYGEWFIDYSGPWPADRPRKESIARTKDVDLDKECIDCSAHDPKIIIANPNQNFTIDDDKLCMSLKYGKYTSYSLIMTKEVFQECYNRWIKPQEEDKSIEKYEVKYEA